MSIENIDRDLCTGCGDCVNNYPMDVIRMDAGDRFAEVRYLTDCMCCYQCEWDCPVAAISVSPARVPPYLISFG